MKRGQAALEFLTTYGWAFLILLVMIGALSYFGVLDPGNLLPDKCVFGTGIGCNDFIIDANDVRDNIRAQLTNGFGYTIIIDGVTVECAGVKADCPVCESGAENYCHLGQKIGETEEELTWKSDERRELVIPFDDISVSDRPTIDVIISYKKGGSSYSKELRGTIQARPIETS